MRQNNKKYRQNCSIILYQSPIGIIEITGVEDGIMSVLFVDGASIYPDMEIPECMIQCVAQLAEYFNGTRADFSVRMRIDGTEFQERVWEELRNIPYGTTTSYLHIAKSIGRPTASRAVGKAVGSNQLDILIPCHRVISTSGSLIKYNGEVWRKEWLLNHERNIKINDRKWEKKL